MNGISSPPPHTNLPTPHHGVPPRVIPQFRALSAMAKKPSPIPLFWALTGIALGTTVAFIIATGSAVNGSNLTYAIPQATLPNKLVIDEWQTFISPKGYSVHYKSPQLFDAAITNKADSLAFYSMFNDKKQTAFILTVTEEKPTLFANKGEPVKFGTIDGILLSSSQPTDVSFDAVYLIRLEKKNFKLHLESSLPQTDPMVVKLKNEIINSFTVLNN